MNKNTFFKGLRQFFYCLLVVFSTHGLRSQTILGIEGEQHTGIGIYIKNLVTDSVIVDHNSDLCLTPASITKLYTAASAMSLLKDDFRFETKVFLTGHAVPGQGVWAGNIVIKASG